MTNPLELIIGADSYKIGMGVQYPEGVTEVYSFIESRGGKFDEIVVLGVRAFIDEYLTKSLTNEMVDELVEFFNLRPEPFLEANFRRLVQINDGYLPLKIVALPEGTVVPTSVPFAYVVNTHPDAYWLTTLVETRLLSSVWYMTTVATLAREIKKIIKTYNDRTSPNFEGLDFQLHNFGDRGATSQDAATKAGVAHLTSFMGTDSLTATRYIMKHYADKDCAKAFSVPASEHSISTAWEGDEKGYILNMIRKFKGNFDIISMVADTYDIFKFVDLICEDQEIRAELADLKAKGKKIVIRPDSGKAEDILPTLMNKIDGAFGTTINAAGYKVLPAEIGFLWGDGIHLDSIGSILAAVEQAGFATQNVVLGMGGALVQQVNRDTLKFAMKASNIVKDGKSIGIAKSPVTAAWKKSKKGKFSVLRNEEGILYWVEGEVEGNLLETFYEDGWIKEQESFDVVRARAM